MFSRMQQWFGNGWLGILDLLITALCVFLSLSVHEFAHGLAAYKMGDDTASLSGRLSLNPLRHLDPIGALCLFFFGFGWARPVPVNPMRFQKKKAGMVITSLAGPFSNFILAFLSVFFMRLLKFAPTQGIFGQVAYLCLILTQNLAIMNISLALFNLIPIPPLDGSKVLNAILPARIYFKIMQYERYGFIVLILLINIPIVMRLLNFCVIWIYNIYNLVFSLIPFLR